MAIVFKNNASTTLSAALSSSATSISVADATKLPSITGDEYFFCTIDDGSNVEIVKVTGISSNTLTVVRAQDNTTALSFSSGDIIEQRLTAAVLETFPQLDVGELTADEFIGDLRGAVIFNAQAGEAIDKGEVVYVSGISGNTPVVALADADDANKMPAFGLALESASLNNSLAIVTFGTISGVDTDTPGFSLGDTLYVSTTPGGLTNSPPAGESSLIQNIGKVQRVHASSGSIKVGGAGRTNAVPNLNDGNIFIGNASNQATTASLNTKIEDYLDGGTSTPSFATISSGAITSTGQFSVNTGATGTLAQFRGADTDLLNIDGDSNAITLDARNVGAFNIEMQGTNALTIDNSQNATFAGTISSGVITSNIASNGVLHDLQIGSSSKGKIRIVDGDVVIHSTPSNHTGIRLGNGYLAITDNTGAISNGLYDLGLNSYKFRDAYFSGTVNTGTISSGAITSTGAITAQGSSGGFFYAEDTTVSTATDDLVGGFLFKSNDASGTEPHYAGMTARQNNIYGSMQLEFFADRADYESDTPGIILKPDGVDSSTNTLSFESSTAITGVTTISSTSMYVDDQIISTGDTDTYFQFNAADTARIVVGGSQKFVVNSSGVSISNGTLNMNSGNLTSVGTISSGAITSTGSSQVADLTVTGDLTVQGTTVTIDAANLNVEDKNITLNYSTGDSSGSANGAGITIQDAVSAGNDATLTWDTSNDSFNFSHDVNVSGAITVDTTTLVVDSTNDRVGIGTATPDALLHLSGGSGEKIIIENAASPRQNYIGMSSSDNLEIAADEDNLGADSSIRFRVDADEKMRISPSVVDVNVFLDLNDNYITGVNSYRNSNGAEIIDANNASYTILKSYAGVNRLWLGETATYLNNTNIYLRDASSNHLVTINSTGLNIRSGGLDINSLEVIDSSRNLTNIGTISSGQLNVNSSTTNTTAVFESTDDKAFIRIKDDDTDAHLIAKDGNFSIADDSGTFDRFRVDLDTGNVDISGTFDSGAISIANSTTAATLLTVGSSSQTNYSLQNFQTDTLSGNTAYLIAYGSGNAQDGNFAMKNTNTGGNIFFQVGTATPLTLTTTGSTFAGDIMPAAENAHNIGSASVRWEDLYVDDGFIRNAYIDEYIYHNGDTDTNLRFQTDRATLTSGGGASVDAHSNGNLYLTGTTVQVYGNYNSTGTISSGAINTTGAITIDVDDQANGALRIEANQTNPNNDFYFAQEIISTLSGTTATTGDREQGGIYMDLNSTATGGDTSNEHRAYGIYIDLDSTGDADNIYGVYSNATATPTTGTTTNVYGGYFHAEDNGGAGNVTTLIGLQGTSVSDNSTSDVNAMYAGYFKSYNIADSAAIGASTAVYGEIEIPADTADIYGNSYVFRAEYDNNGTVAQTNSTYLFYGNYAGVLPTNAYGVYIADTVDNYFAGTIDSGSLTVGPGTQSAASDADITVREGNAFAGIDLKSTRTSGNIGGLRSYNSSDTIVNELLLRVDGSINIINSNGLQINTSTVIDGSRNITAGTISSGNITLTDGSHLQTYDSNGTTGTGGVDLPRGGHITFYGNNNVDHSIGSRNNTGAITDDLRISSYGALYIDLDSNENNSADADFVIGRHGSGDGTMSTLVTISGEDGSYTSSGTISSGDVTTTGINIGTDSGDPFNSQSVIRIQDGGNAYIQIKAGTSQVGGVLIGDVDDDYVGGMLYSNSSNALTFNSGNVLALTLDSSQNATFAGTIDSGNIYADYSLLGRGFRSANRGELHLNATGSSDVSEIFFGYGDGYTDANIRWGISDRGSADDRLIVYRGPDHGGFDEVAYFDASARMISSYNGYSVNGTTVIDSAFNLDNINSIDVTSTTSDLNKFTFTDTVSNATFTGLTIDYDASGSQAHTTDNTHRALFVDVDSSQTGGNTTDENRLYGIHVDVRGTGDTDLRYGVYSYSETQHSSGTVTSNIGLYGIAIADDTGTGHTSNNYGVLGLAYGYNTGTGGTTNHYAGQFKTLLSTANDKNTSTAHGVYAEVEIDDPGQAQTVTNTYGVRSIIDNDSAGNVTMTNAYLFHGDYQGTIPSGGYGLYIGDNVPNYVGGEIRSANNITAYYSDERLKDFHGKIDTPIDKVKQLNGYYFTENKKAKELGYNNDKQQVGVNAQEVQKVLPEVVDIAPISHKEDVDEEYLTVHYDKLVPLLIEAIKEQQKDIEYMKSEIKTLKENNNGN